MASLPAGSAAVGRYALPFARVADPILYVPMVNSTSPFGDVDPADGLTVAVRAIVKPWSACELDDVNVVLVAVAGRVGDTGGALIVISRMLEVDWLKVAVPA